MTPSLHASLERSIGNLESMRRKDFPIPPKPTGLGNGKLISRVRRREIPVDRDALNLRLL
jgi:hypothetical protein